MNSNTSIFAAPVARPTGITQSPKPEWLRVPAAMHLSGFCRSTLYELITQNKITSTCIRKPGAVRGIRVISYDSLTAFIERQVAEAECKSNLAGKQKSVEAAHPASASRFTMRSGREILASAETGGDSYLGDRMLAAGEPALLLGAAGIEKSWLVLQQCICMITGRDFLGLKTHARGRRWLILQTGNSNRRIQTVLKGMVRGLDLSKDEFDLLDRCLLIHTLDTEDDGFVRLDVQEEFKEVQTLITDCNPDFVVFDPLDSFSTRELDASADMRAVCCLITRAVKRGNPNRVPIVVHHAVTEQVGATKAVEWERGWFGPSLKALYGWAHSAFSLSQRDRADSTKLLLECSKNLNGAPFPPIGVKFIEENYLFEIDPSFTSPQSLNNLMGGAQ